MDNTNKTHKTLIQTRNFLIHTCSHCHKEMDLKEGDMIFGGKWFHNACWKIVDNVINENPL